MQIRSLSQLINYVEKNCKRGLYLFRGQPVDKPLRPKIGRDDFLKHIPLIEKRLLAEFNRRSRPLLATPPTNQWDWLALAQHSGLATRLLDWTDNPLAALWFAVRTRAKNEGPAVLWIFRVPQGDIVKSRRKDSPFEGPRTRVFQPRHIAKTIVAQGGWFTVHKYMGPRKRFIPLEINKLYRDNLRKLTIERPHFTPLSRSLDQCGINAASMFPELSGLCEYLNWRELSPHPLPH